MLLLYLPALFSSPNLRHSKRNELRICSNVSFTLRNSSWVVLCTLPTRSRLPARPPGRRPGCGRSELRRPFPASLLSPRPSFPAAAHRAYANLAAARLAGNRPPAAAPRSLFRLGHHLNIRRFGQHRADTGPDSRVIVYQQDANTVVYSGMGHQLPGCSPLVAGKEKQRLTILAAVWRPHADQETAVRRPANGPDVKRFG
jgi:hypothetical protein